MLNGVKLSRRRAIGSLCSLLSTIWMGAAAKPTGDRTRFWLGVSLAGGEFGSRFPGVKGVDYIYPGVKSLDYYLVAGVTIVRIPVRWERIQPVPDAPLDEPALADLDRLIARAAQFGARVILDLHNFGRLDEADRQVIIGEAPGTRRRFADLWHRLATHYRDRSNVVFGLMNEPHNQATDRLVEMLQAGLHAIRAAGASQLVLVSGNHFSGGHSWVSSDNADLMSAITDPANNFAFDVHQYLDSDSSGRSEACTPGAGSHRLVAFTEWARRHGRRAFLGEFGAGSNAPCLQELSDLLTFLSENCAVWIGATYWAGGPWWGDADWSVEPLDLEHPSDRQQFTVLRRFLQSGTGLAVH